MCAAVAGADLRVLMDGIVGHERVDDLARRNRRLDRVQGGERERDGASRPARLAGQSPNGNPEQTQPSGLTQ